MTSYYLLPKLVNIIKTSIQGMIVAIVFVGLCTATAFAWPLIAIDSTVTRISDPYTTESPGTLGSANGFGVGANFDLNKTTQYTRIVARADISYYRWSYSTQYLSGALTRIPLFLGWRVFTKYGVYLDGGLVFTYDYITSSYTGPLYGTVSPGNTSKNSYGGLKLAPGIGIEVPVFSNFTIGAQVRYHMRLGSGVDSYTTQGLFIGYRF